MLRTDAKKARKGDSCHQTNSVILSGMCLAQSARQMESKDPNTARSSTEAARHSPRGPYRGVVRMPCPRRSPRALDDPAHPTTTKAVADNLPDPDR